MKELDLVVLTRDLPLHDLRAGDIGAVVYKSDSESYEVEFVSADGATLAVVTLTSDDVRPLDGAEILHARRLAKA